MLILILRLLLIIFDKMATRMRIQKTKNEQYIVTIPKAFAETFDFRQGTLVEFKINKEGEILMRKIRK